LKLNIRPDGNGRGGRPKISIEVVNGSEKPLRWDREFSAFLQWKIAGATRQVDRRVSRGARRPTPAEVERRFIWLRPAEAVTKDLDLEAGVSVLATKQGFGEGAAGHVIAGIEERISFVMPATSRVLGICVGYVALPENLTAFESWFGRDPIQLGFWEGALWSPRVEVNLAD
jgi:hypothetical protein